MKIFTDRAFDDACKGHVSYGFFGRTGGVSRGIYDSLNCGPGSGDDADAVVHNRRRVAAKLGVTGKEISSLQQCHSDRCLFIDTPVPVGEARPQADALVTDCAGLAIGALSADCGPVLFIGRKANGAPVIGATHAGWGGALGGVLENTVATMIHTGARIESIKACLGPCITGASYEVKEDFMNPFIERHAEAEHFFKAAHKPGHLMFDLPGYIAMRLALAGVRQVSLMGVDTYKDEEHCFSFRRATHRGEPDYGRQISAIVINP